MAKQQQPDTSQSLTHTFLKGLNKDSDPSFVQQGMWTHAINAVNNTGEGNVGTLSNESSNYLCITAGQTMPAEAVDKYIIGAINVFSDKNSSSFTWDRPKVDLSTSIKTGLAPQ